MARLAPFELERWFTAYGFTARYNICGSSAAPLRLADLLALADADDLRRFSNLVLEYAPNSGTDELRAEIAREYERLGPEHVEVTTGASEAIYLLMSSLLEPGDSVVVEAPVYQCLFEPARALGARVKLWQLRPEQGYAPDFTELERLLDARTRLIAVNRPHSPTGAALRPDELRRLVDLAEERRLYLFSDEVYRHLPVAGLPEPPAGADLSRRVVSVGDLSKAYGLGGLRVGWIACRDRSVLDRCASLRDYTSMCNSSPGQFLAELALKHRATLLWRSLALARSNLALLQRFMAANADILSWVPPAAGLSAFPSYTLPLPSRQFCLGLLEEEGTLLLPGDVFGVERAFRIGFGGPTADFAAGLARLDAYLRRLRDPAPGRHAAAPA